MEGLYEHKYLGSSLSKDDRMEAKACCRGFKDSS